MPVLRTSNFRTFETKRLPLPREIRDFGKIASPLHLHLQCTLHLHLHPAPAVHLHQPEPKPNSVVASCLAGAHLVQPTYQPQLITSIQNWSCMPASVREGTLKGW